MTSIVSTKAALTPESSPSNPLGPQPPAMTSSIRPPATSSRRQPGRPDRPRHRHDRHSQGARHVVFHDDKEGLLGIRVAHLLESPTEKGGTFIDASGNPTQVKAADTSGATGVYLTSEGITGDAAWATRGRWCFLTGETSGHTETIAIIDNPKNPGYPTYWHARGYGLFAANPLGRSIFDIKQPAFNFTIDKDQTATFRYRIILSSHSATPDEMNKEADTFAAELK